MILLAQDMTTNTVVFTAPLVPPTDLQTAVTAYKFQRREHPRGAWSDVGIAIENEITLTNQERDKKCEYRVLAVNKACIGKPSNTVKAVL